MGLALAGCAAAVAAQEAGTAPRVEALNYTGDGRVASSGEPVQLWLSSSHEFTVTVSADAETDAEVCLVVGPTDAENRTELGCKPASIPANGTASVPISMDSWPANLTGAGEVRGVVRLPNASKSVVGDAVAIDVFERDGDPDGDGLSNRREATVGTALRSADTDGDGLDDGAEVQTYETSPVEADTDGDGLTDRAEIEIHQTDPTSPDGDDDGLPDGREVTGETNPNKADTDGDGVEDALEVNTYDTDPTDPDTDDDGLDDGAEIEIYETNPAVPDTDGDGLEDAIEVNTYGTDPNKVDTDGDGLADGREVAEYQTDPAVADTDGDGLADGREVNALGTSPTNADTDSDGLSDGAEVEQHGTDPTSADSDGDGRSDRIEVTPAALPSLVVPAVLGGVLAILAGLVGALSRARGWSRFTRAQSVEGTDENADRKPGREVDRSEEADGSTDALETPDVPPEFLPNEEQILRLIDEHGGRVPQSTLVEETGWSKSKVSRVLAGMAEDDRIVKIDVGKGNVVTRPEDLPEGARPPFEA